MKQRIIRGDAAGSFRQAWGARRLIRNFYACAYACACIVHNAGNMFCHRHFRFTLWLGHGTSGLITHCSSALLPCFRAYYGLVAQTHDRVSTSLYKLGLARYDITRHETGGPVRKLCCLEILLSNPTHDWYPQSWQSHGRSPVCRLIKRTSKIDALHNWLLLEYCARRFRRPSRTLWDVDPSHFFTPRQAVEARNLSLWGAGKCNILANGECLQGAVMVICYPCVP